MKVAFVSLENPFDMLNNGGIGTYTQIMAKGLAELGHQIHIITVGEEQETKIIDSVHVHFISKCEAKNLFYLEQAYKFFCKVKEVKIKFGLDIVEAPEWLGQGYFIASEGIVPLVTRVHTPLFLIESICNGQRIYRNNEEIKESERVQAVKSIQLTTPCQSIKEIIENEWNVSSIVIPNPIDVSSFKVRHNKESYVLYMGRLEYRKGVLVLAESLEKVFKEYPDERVIFCGRDTIYGKRSVKSLIVSKCKNYLMNIDFLEHVSGASKQKLISSAKVVVLPSIWENCSYVALEALSLGKTVIATETGGFTEMIETSKNGYLVEPNNSMALSETICKVLQKDQRLTTSVVREMTQAVFDTKIICAKYERLFENIINGS